jgi:hypothetical protein
MDADALAALLAEGGTIGDVARALGVDPSTARKRLRALGLETRRQRVMREAAQARDRGEAGTERTCATHGLVRFRIATHGTYRCVRCASERVAERRRAIKRALIADLGGSCVLCGYAACERALHFHHVDPGEKAFAIAFEGVTRSLERARAEAAKCVLLCANCHAEVEAGVAALP